MAMCMRLYIIKVWVLICLLNFLSLTHWTVRVNLGIKGTVLRNRTKRKELGSAT